MVVYGDVLIIINLYVNYLLLMCTKSILKRPVGKRRILFGALVGSLYGLIILVPDLPKILEIAIRPIATGIITYICFGYVNFKNFIRCFLTFFAVGLVFGGLMLLIWLILAPMGMVYKNGAVYFDISLTFLAISTVACYGCVTFVAEIIRRRAPKDHLASVKIICNGKTVELNGLIDTGNSLTESFSGYPVVVCELDEIKTIVPKSVLNGYDCNDIDDVNIRFVLYHTVAGVGMLPAFRPDFFEVKTINKTIKTSRVYIAVTDKNIAYGEYGIIINQNIISEEETYAYVD